MQMGVPSCPVLTLGRLVGDLDGVLQDADREALIGQGAEKQSEFPVDDGITGREPFDDILHT